MNILLVSNTEDLYGASKCLLRLARELVTLGHNVSVVVPGSGILAAELRRSGAQVIVHPLLWTIDRKALAGVSGIARFAYAAIPSIAFVGWQVLRRQIHVIHSNTAVILAPAVAASLLRKPHVWHIRESFEEFPALWSIHRRAMYWFSSVILAISRPIGDQFPSRHSQKVRVIHDGLSSSEFLPVAKEKLGLFREMYRLGTSTLVGIAGRIKWKRKGQEVFVRAAARIKERFPDVRYVIIGSPYPGNEDHLVRLIDLIKALGLERQVILTGDIEEMQVAYSALDILVMASTQMEPFGMVVLEAMALGKPVIRTRDPVALEQVEDGVSGLLFEPGNDEELASKMEILLADPDRRAAMGRAARQRCEELFGGAASVGKICSVYREVDRRT